MAIKVNWSQAGAAPQPVLLIDSIPVNEFVTEFLDMSAAGFELLLNGEPTDGSELVEDGDEVTLNPKKSYNG